MQLPRWSPVDIAIVIGLAVFGVMTLYPFWYILVISFSTPEAYFASDYHLIPSSFTIEAYQYNLENPQLTRSLANSIFITTVGTTNSLIWTTITGYFLSKRGLAFVAIIFTLFLVTLFFDGGLVPKFILIRQLGLRNNLLSVILPFTINPFFLILTKNYFRTRNPEIEEAARVDGASAFTILFRIVVPTSKPILATIGLFYAVQYWNDWFWPMIYLSERELFPLALHLRNIVTQSTSFEHNTGGIGVTSPATIRASTIVLTIIPIVLAYPFVQRYFVHGILLGSSKE